MRKIWILSALIMLIITLYQINSAYAKYYTEAKGTIEEQIKYILLYCSCYPLKQKNLKLYKI